MNRFFLQCKTFVRERFGANGFLTLAIIIVLGLGVGAVFGRVPPLYVLLAGIGLATAAWILRSPFAGLLLITFFLPFERIGSIETSAGTLRLTQLLLAVTLVAFWLGWVKGRERFCWYPLLVPLFTFLAANVLGLLHTPNRQYSTEIFFITIFTMLVSVLVPQLATSEKKMTVLVRVLLLSALLVCAFGIFQFFGDLIGLPTSITGLRDLYTKEVFGFPRIQSTALEPLYFANYLLIPLSLAYALFLRRWKQLPSWFLFGLLILFGGNLLLTVSRGGYAGMALSLIAITLISFRQFFRVRVLIPILVGIMLVLFGLQRFLNFGDFAHLNIDTFTQHIVEVFSGPSFQERINTIEQAREAFWLSPWVGLGPGSFGPFAAIHPLVKPESGWLIVNNEPLELLAETGLLGFLSIVAMVYLLFLRSIRAAKKVAQSSGFLHAVHIGCLGALLGILVQYQTFSVLYIMHVWFLIGLLIAVQSLLLGKQKEDSYG